MNALYVKLGSDPRLFALAIVFAFCFVIVGVTAIGMIFGDKRGDR